MTEMVNQFQWESRKTRLINVLNNGFGDMRRDTRCLGVSDVSQMMRQWSEMSASHLDKLAEINERGLNE